MRTEISGMLLAFNRCNDVRNFLSLEPLAKKHLKYVVTSCIPGKAIACPKVFLHDDWDSIQRQGFFECLRLDVFPENEQWMQIETIDDFLSSNCLASIILYDACVVEVYSKKFSTEIRNYALNHGAKLIEEYEKSSIERTDFNF